MRSRFENQPCDTNATAEDHACQNVFKVYKLPNGGELPMTIDEFKHLVESIRMLKIWRDECNEIKK